MTYFAVSHPFGVDPWCLRTLTLAQTWQEGVGVWDGGGYIELGRWIEMTRRDAY